MDNLILAVDSFLNLIFCDVKSIVENILTEDDGDS